MPWLTFFVHERRNLYPENIKHFQADKSRTRNLKLETGCRIERVRIVLFQLEIVRNVFLHLGHGCKIGEWAFPYAGLRCRKDVRGRYDKWAGCLVCQTSVSQIPGCAAIG